MPTVNELFSDTVDKTLVIDWDTKTIKIPSSITNIGVESDDETTILDFKMPRYKGKIDLKGYVVRINYHNANGEGDVYTAKDVAVDDEFITFSWEVGRFAVMYKGDVKFIVCAKKFASDGITVDKECNTTTAILPCLVGLETEQAVVESYLDAIASAAYETILLALDSDLKGEPGYTPIKGTDYYTPEEREDFLNDVVLGAKALYANAFTNEVSGEVIRVDDVSPIEHSPEVKIYGKNLFSLSNEIDVDSTYKSWLINPKRKRITMSLIEKDPSVDLSEIFLGFSTNGKNGTYGGALWMIESGKVNKASVTTDKPYVSIYKGSVSNAIDLVAQRFDIQVEFGDVVTEYEPYVDPTTVTLTRCGKNLIDVSQVKESVTNYGLTVTRDGDILTFSGTPTQAVVMSNVSFLINAMLGENYVMSYEYLTGSVTGTGSMCIGDTDSPENARQSWGNVKLEGKSRWYTCTTIKPYIKDMWFYIAEGTVFNNYKIKVYLEHGSEPTGYEPYKGETYTPNANGTVDISTVSPTMTLFTDTPGITIDCKYGRDTNLIMGDISNALDELHNYAQGVVAGGVSV